MKEHENFILKISDEKKREIQEDAQKMLEPIIPYLQDFFTKHERFVSAYKGISFHKLLIGKEQGSEVVETYNDLALFMDFRNDNGYFTVLKNKKMETKDGIINIMSDGIAKYDYSTPEREYTKEDWDKVDEMESEMGIEYNSLKKAFDDYMNKCMKIIHEIKYDPKDGLKFTFYGKGIRDLALGNK